MGLNTKTFFTRLITAIVFVAVLLVGICFNFVLCSFFFFIISIWGLVEFYQLVEKLNAKPYKFIGLFLGAILFFYGVIGNTNASLFLPTEAFFSLLLIVVFCVFIFVLFDQRPDAVLNLSFTFAGIIYVVVPFILFLNITCLDRAFTFKNFTNTWYGDFAPYNFHFALGIILLIWASDVGAYLVGSLLGKHKLFERISPGKTWEGTIGSFIINIACAFLIARWFQELELKHWIVISVLISVFGTIGDLIESKFKRLAGIKDSGKILPGHGGILDRFDSLLFVSPFIYCYLSIIKLL
ncbi:MAG: phosphatidate cytidylyltransferase [Bacteroidota bacterium]|jgi:phosphatidate cytidylyltransferase